MTVTKTMTIFLFFSCFNDGNSKTKIPNLYKYLSSNIILCDCPGFFDTEGSKQDISNAFAIDYLLSKASHVKILLVLSEFDISTARSMVLRKATTLVENLFPDYQEKINIICMVVTKAGYEQNPMDFLPLDIDKEKPTLLNFFRDHATNQLFQFSCPQSGCLIYNDFQDKPKILNFIFNVPSAKIYSHGIALSNESKLLILQTILTSTLAKPDLK